MLPASSNARQDPESNRIGPNYNHLLYQRAAILSALRSYLVVAFIAGHHCCSAIIVDITLSGQQIMHSTLWTRVEFQARTKRNLSSLSHL